MKRRRLVVTAGPTREHLDPVRFLSNPSTGRMGFAIAKAAVEKGFEVVLIAGPVALKTPKGVKRIDVVSAREMCAAALVAAESADVFVATAAVADWRPAKCAARKLKKGAMSGVLHLARNPDILKTVSARMRRSNPNAVVVGFAAETGDPMSEAVRKCREKGLDFIVANDVTAPDAGFGVSTNRAVIVDRDGKCQALALMSKLALARRVVSRAILSMS